MPAADCRNPATRPTATPGRSTTTDDNGFYTFQDVSAPEHYIVEVRYTPSGNVLVTSTPQTVSASQQLTVNLSIPID